ncbi:MAG TPA: OmpA family protein [Mizugakiibacter sp.]
MKRKGLLALVALVIGGVGIAHAADYSNWYIAPRVGAVFPDSNRKTQESPLLGLGVGYWVNPDFAVDFEATHNNADFKDNSPRPGKQWESMGLDVAGRWMFSDWSGWRPYVMGGIGMLKHAAVSAGVPAAGSGGIGSGYTHGWGPMVTAGVGIQKALTDRVAFRGEVAYRLDRDTQSARFAGLEDHKQYGDALATIGLVISMGQPAPAPAAAPAPAPAPTCDQLDDDKDGVNNCDDKCPNTPAGTIVGPDGCPQKVVIDLRGVNFKYDRPKKGETDVSKVLKEPTEESMGILDQAVDTLKRYPQVRVEVDGYTDDKGKDDYNQALSERRAKIVYDYLVSHGIDASRLDGPKGFGESNPIDTNSTEEGRSRNRRVELKVLDQGAPQQ